MRTKSSGAEELLARLWCPLLDSELVEGKEGLNRRLPKVSREKGGGKGPLGTYVSEPGLRKSQTSCDKATTGSL